MKKLQTHVNVFTLPAFKNEPPSHNPNPPNPHYYGGNKDTHYGQRDIGPNKTALTRAIEPLRGGTKQPQTEQNTFKANATHAQAEHSRSYRQPVSKARRHYFKPRTRTRLQQAKNNQTDKRKLKRESTERQLGHLLLSGGATQCRRAKSTTNNKINNGNKIARGRRFLSRPGPPTRQMIKKNPSSTFGAESNK